MTTKQSQSDMLHGPMMWKIVLFALPLAATSALEQIFNSVDVAVVGRFASSEALAAVGANAPVISLFITLVVGISLGANAILSNFIGQKDNEGISRGIQTTLLMGLGVGILFMLCGLLIAQPMLVAIDTPREVLSDAVLYLRVYFVGIPFLVIFNFCSAILRSMGDTRRPLYILVVAGVVNTILNLVFVIVFHLGVAGVAIATSIANALSASLVVYLLTKEQGPFRLHLRGMRLYKREMRRILKIGVPAGIQGMVFAVSNIIIQSEINSYGPYAVAGSAAALNFEYYCYYIISAFNGAAITFIGQNYGAGKMDRVRSVFRICMAWALLLSCAANLFFVFLNPFFLSLFTADPLVYQYGSERMLIVLSVQWIACSYEVSASALRGMGISIPPTVLVIFGTCVLRVAWVYLICPTWHSFGALMTVYPVSWAVTGVMVFTMFLYVMKRVERVGCI